MAAFLPEHSSTTCDGAVGDPLGLPAAGTSRGRRVQHLGGTEVASQLLAPLAGLHGDDRSDAPGHQGGDGQGADRSRTDDHDACRPRATPDRVIPCSATASGSASAAARRAVRPAGRRSSDAARHQHVAGEGPVVAVDDRTPRFSHCDGFPSRQRRHARSGARAHPPPGRRSPSPLRPHPAAATLPVNSWPATRPGLSAHPSSSSGCPTRRSRSGPPRPGPRRARAGAPVVPRPRPRPAAGRPRPASPRADPP